MSRVVGLGCDIHQLSRVKEILTKNGLQSQRVTRLSTRILHPLHEYPIFEKFREENELSQCSKILSNSWSCKEAVYKSLDPLAQSTFSFNQWYKINDNNGKPCIKNDEYLKVRSNENFLLSVSHDGDYIMATVLRELDQSNTDTK